MVGCELDDYREAVRTSAPSSCVAIHRLPQPVIARVHGIATAAGCQLVAACDLAVADEGRRASPRRGCASASSARRPMVEVSRAVGRKQALELLADRRLRSTPRPPPSGAWINRAVPADEVDAAVADLAARVMRGSSRTIEIGASGRSTSSSTSRSRDAYAPRQGRSWPRNAAEARRAGGHLRVPGQARAAFE